MSEGYDGLPAYYSQSSDPLTPNFGFSLKGMDPILAENFVIADAAIAAGGGSSVKINGVSVSNPNFNDTTPAAPSQAGLVSWQKDGSGNVSAYFGGAAKHYPNLTISDGSFSSISFSSTSQFGVFVNGFNFAVIDNDFGAELQIGDNSGHGNFSLLGAGSAKIQTDTAGNTITIGATVLTLPSAITVPGLVITDGTGSQWGSPTGGAQGAGTINAQGLFVNGVAVATSVGSGTVTSFSAGNLSPLFTTSVATATTTPALSFALSTQNANLVFAGPTSGGAGAPTFRALVAADIPPGGAVSWDTIGNAAGNLTLANAAFTTTFNQTTGTLWTWANLTAATATAIGAPSPAHLLNGTFFTSGASAADSWSLQNVPQTPQKSATVTNIVENSSSVVTLTITGGNFTLGATVTFTGLTTGTWLNGQNATLTTITGAPGSETSIVFTDPTSHGTQASHAETGQVTQNNVPAQLQLTHSGSARPQIQIPNITENITSVGPFPTICSALNATTGINVARSATAVLDVIGPNGGNNPSILGVYAGNGTGASSAVIGMGYFSTTGEARLWGANTSFQVLSLRSGNSATLATAPCVVIGAQALSATTGTQQVGVSLGSSELAGGNAYPQLAFTVASGAVNFIPARIQAQINQTGTASGNYTGLLLSMIETAVLGSANKLIDLQSGTLGTTSRFSIDNTGKVFLPNASNTATSASAGTNGAVPAQVVGYIIVNVAGTNVKVPYFAT